MSEAKEHLGTLILHLISGEDVVADVTSVGPNLYCQNPLVIEETGGKTSTTQLLSFRSFIPMFTGESIAIPDDKVVFVASPNPLLVKFYHEFLRTRKLWNSINKISKNTEKDKEKHLTNVFKLLHQQ